MDKQVTVNNNKQRQEEDYDDEDYDDSFSNFSKQSPHVKNFARPFPLLYWDFTNDQLDGIIKTKFDASKERQISFVILNTWSLDPRIDLPLDNGCWNKPEVNLKKATVFILAKIIEHTPDGTDHDRRAILRLVDTRNDILPQVQTHISNEIKSIKKFHSTLGVGFDNQYREEFDVYDKRRYPKAGSKTYSALSLLEPSIVLSSREYRTDKELENVLTIINIELSNKQFVSRVQRTKNLDKYQSITKFARILPNTVNYDSVRGFHTRHIVTPKTNYGYTPDAVYDANFIRVWITNKELVPSITSILESPKFNGEYGTFRLFQDEAFDAQWRFTFRVSFTEVYKTKSYKPMSVAIKNRYFGSVGKLKQTSDKKKKITEPLFLDVEFDSLLPDKEPPIRDYSADALHVDIETSNTANKVSGEKMFPIPYINALNLERQLTKKILSKEGQTRLNYEKSTLCPNCPHSKKHRKCKTCTPEQAEEIDTKAYITALKKEIANDETLSELYPESKPGDWIPDQVTGVDKVLTICFTVANVRDMYVSHPCDASTFYILTYIPEDIVNRDEFIDSDIILASKRFKKTKFRICDDELDLILKFAEKVREIFPIKLCGYNLNGFDIPFLQDRIKWYMKFGTENDKKRCRENPFGVGIMRYYQRDHKNKIVVRPGSGRRTMTTTFPSIIPILDVLEGVGNETFSRPSEMASNKLNNVAAASLLFPGTKNPMLKVSLDVTKGLEMWRQGGAQATHFMCYCLWDSLLSLGLARKFSFDELSDTISAVTGLAPNYTYCTGVREKENMLYHQTNAELKRRFVLPCEKGGAMILFHHPDIWCYSPDLAFDDDANQRAYSLHKKCPRTKNRIPHIYEVIERRKQDSWKKGAQRNFYPTDYTPKTTTNQYQYGERIGAFVMKQETNNKDNYDGEDKEEAVIEPMQIDLINYDEMIEIGKKKVEQLEDQIKEIQSTLKSQRGDTLKSKKVRFSGYYTIKNLVKSLDDEKKQLDKIRLDQSIKNETGITPKNVDIGKKKKGKKAKPIIGAEVLDMIRGYNESWVLFTDFNSLYPSIMLSNYLCFNTFYPRILRWIYPEPNTKYKSVILGPYKNIFSGDYCYDWELARENGYTSPELAETSWIRDPDCLTVAIMDKLLLLRNAAKGKMAEWTKKYWDRNFDLFIRDYDKQPLSKILARLSNEQENKEDNVLFGNEDAKSSPKTIFLKDTKNENPNSLLDITKYIPKEGYVYGKLLIEDVKIQIINCKNEAKKYDTQQNGFKVVMNSGYGFMASNANLNLQEGAATITSQGRYYIKKVVTSVMNTSVLKVMTRNNNLGAYLLTLAIHPGVLYKDLIKLHPEWPPVTDEDIERLSTVCIWASVLGGDTDSAFSALAKTLINILMRNVGIYPTKYDPVSKTRYVDYKDKPLSKYDMVKIYAEFQSYNLVQNMLPYEYVAIDKQFYQNLDSKTQEADMIAFQLCTHKMIKLVIKKKMAVEKIADRFEGFGKKRYCFFNLETKKLVYKGISMVRGDSIKWAIRLLETCQNMLFEVKKSGGSLEERIVAIFTFCQEKLEELALGKNINIVDFELSQRLKKDTALYQNEPPHVRVAKKEIQRGSSIGPQSLIRYVYYLDVSGEAMSNRAAEVEKWIGGKSRKSSTLSGEKVILKQASTREKSPFDLSKLEFTKGKPKELSLPGNFKMLSSTTVREDVDTIQYVLANGYMLNIPYYIKAIIPVLARVLSPLLGGNDEYPQFGDEVDKAEIEKIEAAQKKFAEEQKRQAETLLWTNTLKTRVNDMLDWFKCKVMIQCGQVPLQITSKCIYCSIYFKYQPKDGFKTVNLKSIKTICTNCVNKTPQDFALANQLIVRRKRDEMKRARMEYFSCIRDCEKCIIRPEVSIQPQGIVNSGRWNGSKDELIQKMSTGTVNDIEDLHHLVSRVEYLRTLTPSATLLNDGKETIIIESIYKKDTWITNPFECKFEDCKIYKTRRTTSIKYSESLSFIESLNKN